MTIKISDSLLNKPMYPGGISDGTEYVTRQFGNRDQQVSGQPNVPGGYGGVQNQSAGSEYQAQAKAVAQVVEAVNNTTTYFDNVKMADEDSRQKSMFLRIQQKTEQLRKDLRADPAMAGKSEAVQQSAYENQRNAIIDAEVSAESFSVPKIQKFVQDSVGVFKTNDGIDYNQKVLVPSMVQARKLRDGQDVETIVGTAMTAQSPEAAAKAAALIADRYTSPDAYATYGAVNAAALQAHAMDVLTKGVTQAMLKSSADEFTSLPSKLGIDGPVLGEAIKEGPIAAFIDDRVGKLDAVLQAAGASDGERLLAREQYRKQAEMNARAAISTHNEAWKAVQKEKTDSEVASVTTMGDLLYMAASKGQANDTLINNTVNSTLTALGIDPVAAAHSELTDPREVKLLHAVITQVARATAEQQHALREQARANREIESLRLQREQLIMPTTQKGADLSFADFAKQNNLQDKPVITYTPDDWTKFNAYVARTSPTHLPAPVEHAITWGLNSGDPAAVRASLTAFKNLEQVAPGLSAKVDTRTREIAQRLMDGQDIKTALAAVNSQATLTVEQKKAVEETTSKTIEQWKRSSTHPVAQALGVQSLQPAVMAFANREYSDAIARGESPAVAQKTMLAKVQAYAGKTTLMSGDGTKQLAINAPEVRFNVGKQQGPGWFASMLGARPNPNVVTQDALREDLKATLKANNIPEDTKYFLGQPIERGGKPFYPILLIKEGAHAGPAMDASGSPILWTFDPENNPVMNAAREKVAKFDEAAAKAKIEAAIETEYRTLVTEAQRQKTTRGDLGGKRSWNEAELRAQARKNITGQ